MATKSTFVPTVLGITAFFGGNGIDFVLEGPNKPQTRVTSVKGKRMLDGKTLGKAEAILDASGEPVKVTVKWGRETITLGRRTKAAGDVSFYRSLEPSNKVAGPKTAADILAALEAFNTK